MPRPLTPALYALLQTYVQWQPAPLTRRELWLEAVEGSWLTSTRAADGTLHYRLTTTGHQVLKQGWY